MIDIFSNPIKENIHTPSKELVVDTLSGFFARDSVQIDKETLEDWMQISNENLTTEGEPNQDQRETKTIDQVKIETETGNSTLCKVKKINNKKFKGRNLIRIPEKICDKLEIKNEDLVKVNPLF